MWPFPAESIYCASKAAISHLTKCLAVEWGGDNITVNAVAPTFIETPGTEAALADDAFRADVEERIAGLHRIGRPVDVTGAVIFLASPAAALVTGTTLMVDGGMDRAIGPRRSCLTQPDRHGHRLHCLVGHEVDLVI